MVVESVEQTHLWRLLWSHATRQILATFPHLMEYQPDEVGAGIGFRSRLNRHQAIILHPAGQGREIGDLAVTVVGGGTQVIPRYNRRYIEYLADVGDAVEAVVRSHMRP